MQFRKIEIKDFDTIKKIQATTQYNGSDFSELYLRGWLLYDFAQMQISIDNTNEIVYIRFIPSENVFGIREGSDYCYLSPLCRQGNIPFAVEQIVNFCAENNEDMRICGMPRAYAEMLNSDKFSFEDNADYREYLYSPTALIELGGKKYHSKRNHIARFLMQYSDRENAEENYVFRPYTTDDRKGIRKLMRGWQETKDFDDDALANETEENMVLEKALEFVQEKDNFFCNVIEINHAIAAFTIGELTPSNVAVIHIEKADVAYDGIYPAINQMFVKAHFANARFVNRQEDMGLEGLRKSKSSYYPIGFVEQCVVRLKESE
ncbi:MAG: phosphatidylglycerol lysyltransferase domain-containing protein [Clostridia bacterium]